MKYEEINIGDVAELSHQLTDEDVKRFVELTGDDNRIHTDAAFTAETSFKKPVAHGMLGASFISTIIGTKLPGDGALWFAQNLEFLLPVRVGDTLTVRAEVIKKENRSKVIELQTDITNQHHQKVTQGVAKVKVVEREAEALVKKEIERNKVALVVGGSGGIGSAVCLALAAAGFDIAVHYYKDADSARDVAEKVRKQGRKAFLFNGDITDRSAVKSMVEGVVRRFSTVSTLVNCSTVKIAPIKFSDLDWHDIELHFNNQIRGSFNLTSAIVPHMEKERYGKIVHIDTQYVDSPTPHMLAYITAKSALRGFTKSIAYDLAAKGIRVNMVSPGMTNTDQIADVPERIRLVTAANTPLKRLATPEDVANAVVFLASEQSDFLCGETIRVNGGQVMV